METINLYEAALGKDKLKIVTGEKLVNMAAEAARLNKDFRVRTFHFPAEYAPMFLKAVRELGYN